MSAKKVSAEEMRQAVAPLGGTAPEDPPFEDETGLHPEAIAFAQGEDEESLASVLGREGFGGRPVAQLLIAAVRAFRRYSPAADQLAEAEQELEAAARDLEAMKTFRAATAEAAVDRAASIEEATTRWSRALGARGEAQTAADYIAFLESYFPALFGVEPQVNFFVGGTLPKELADWFRRYRVDPNTFNSWRDIGRTAEPKPRRRIVTAAGARQTPR